MVHQRLFGHGGRIQVAAFVAGFLVATTMSAAPAPVLPPDIPLNAVGAALQVSLAPAASSGKTRNQVQRFYALRDYRPAWIGTLAADEALHALEGAAADGLEPARYHAMALAARHRFGSVEDAAKYEIVLTDGLLNYAHDLRRGQVNPEKVDKMVALSRPPFDPVVTLSAAITHGRVAAWLASLAPAHPEYAKLKVALNRYRKIVAEGGWPHVPEARKILLEAGNPMLVPLQKRLAVEDSQLSASAMASIPDLEAAVKRFQMRNGLEVDGVVGRKTIMALNISASERVAQIEANMERWRWLPHEFPSHYIAVNAADATMKVVEDGKTILTSRVIVGKPKTQTAIFDTKVIALTINPPWNVPTSIARNEILPKLRRNPDYLVKHHMIEMGSPLRIQQLPGDDNSLGYLKLEMPNEYSMYLHDTNARSLFKRENRHLSHGCIRVQNIRPLASYLLSGSPQAAAERIDAAIVAGETQKIALDRPVPVYVLYWTVLAEQNGMVEFRPDVYGRDKRLISALAELPRKTAASLTETDCSGWVG